MFGSFFSFKYKNFLIDLDALYDMLGLVRSFYLGGTITVLSSLWPIEDEGTRIFMEIFHKHAQKGDYGKAWLIARNHLKNLEFPPSVYGAFILGGIMKRTL